MDGAGLAELTDGIVGAFTETELKELVRTTMGVGLFEEFAAPGTPLRTIAFNLLEAVDHRGTTLTLLRGVARARPDKTDLQDTLRRLCPEALTAPAETGVQVEAVKAGLNVVRSRINEPAVAGAISASRGDLERISGELGMLASYKALHDGLQRIQMQPYPEIRASVKRFRPEDRDIEAIENQLDQLRLICVDLRSAAGGLPDTIAGRQRELKWIEKLGTVVITLATAIETMNQLLASGAVRAMRDVIRREPPVVNSKFTDTADRLNLERLTETIEKVSAAFPTDGGPAGELRKSLSALRQMAPELKGRVAEHLEWQDVENKLWAAEENIQGGTDDRIADFELDWPGIEQQVRAIAGTDPSSQWSIDLAKRSSAVGLSLNGDRNRLPFAFDRYRREALIRFYTVDKSLKAQCDSIMGIGQPIQRLLLEV